MPLPFRSTGVGLLIISGDTLHGQDALAASGSAGSDLVVVGGAGDGVGAGGDVTATAGAAGATANAAGGNVAISATNSAATGTGNGGNVTIVPGLAQGTGADGLVIIDAGSADTSPLLRLDNAGGANGAITEILTGTQDPSSAAISAVRGSMYLRNPGGGTAGSLWVNTSTTDPGTTWVDVSATSAAALAGLPGNIYENLEFYVDPADRNSFPGTGTTAFDLEENGTSGTLSAAAVFDNGAWTFGGESVAGDDVSFTKDAVLDNIFATGGTVIAFVRPFGDGLSNRGRVIDTTESTTSAGFYLCATGQSNGYVDLEFRRNTDAAAGVWQTDNVTDDLGDTHPPLNNGSWACVSITYDDSALTTDPVIRLNGTALSVSESFTPSGNAGSDAGNPIYIGNRSDLTQTWDGQLATILMFDRVLSYEEIQQVTGVFAPRGGIGFRGIDAPTGANPISGQDVNIRAGDTPGTGNSSHGGNVIIQAGSATGASFTNAGEVVIRSGNSAGGSAAGSRVLIESGQSSSGSSVTLRGGVQNTGNNGIGSLLIHASDNAGTGFPADVLIRGGGATQSGRTGGTMTVRGGDGFDFATPFNAPGGAATFRGGDGEGFSANGGSCTVRAGNGGGGGDGAALILESGTPGLNNNGGAVSIRAHDGGAFGTGGSITVTAGSSLGSNDPGGTIDFTTGSNTQGNFTDLGAGDFTITTGSASFAATQPGCGGGSFRFTGGSSNANVATSPGGGFIVLCGPGVLGSANSRGGPVTMTAGDVEGAVAGAVAGAITLTGGQATGASGQTSGAANLIGGAAGISGAAAGQANVTGGAGSAAGAGGSGNVNGGAAGGTIGADGGGVNISGGSGTAAGLGTGGATLVRGGLSGSLTGESGPLTLQSTSGGGTSGNSGAVAIRTGITTSGNVGALTITGGAATVGDGGGVAITSGAGGTVAADAAGDITVDSGPAGAGSASAGGNIAFTTGAGGSVGGAGGDFTVAPGAGNGAGEGGDVSFLTGAGGATGTGGDYGVLCGPGGSTSGAGGNISMSAGPADGSGVGGVVLIAAGDGATAGDGGEVSLIGGGDGGGSGVQGVISMRQEATPAANRVQFYTSRTTTAVDAGTVTMEVAYTLDTNETAVMLRGDVYGMSQADADDGCRGTFSGTWIRSGGTVSALFSTVTSDQAGGASTDTPPWAVTIDISGNDIRIRILGSESGGTNTTVTWVANWTAQEVS